MLLPAWIPSSIHKPNNSDASEQLQKFYNQMEASFIQTEYSLDTKSEQ